ncbi:MAG: type I secretion system permease/ATPase [Pseudomonadota bacterium]
MTGISGKDIATDVLRRHRYFLGFALLFSVFANFLMLTGPLFMLQVYDRVLGSRSEETLVALLVLVLALYGLMWLLNFARTRLVARYGARFQVALDAVVFRAEMRRPAPGQQTPTASRDLEAVQGLFGSPALIALMDLPFTPLFIGVIFAFHTWLGLFALAGGVLLICITILNQALTSQRVAQAQSTGEATYKFAENARAAAELIRSQGMLDAVTDRWQEGRTHALRQNMVAVDWTGAFSTFTQAFRLALQSLVLALGAWLVLKGDMTAGAMIAGSILLGRALAPIEQIIGRWPQIARARSGWRDLMAFLESAEEPVDRTRLPRPNGQLDVKGVTITKGPGQPPVLYNISFTLRPGDALGVIGKSGSGKTTIAKAILGLVNPSIGEVRLGGALMSHYSPADLGSHIGYLPQDPILITGTIAENIARMARDPDSQAVVAAAQKANVHDLILTLPEGYDTRVRDNMIELSGGQRQRIALARALYGEPMLLVLDEPNSALDQDGSEALNAAVRQMKAEGRTVIIMTHRPMAISECDKLMVVESGRMSAFGPRDEVLRNTVRNVDDVQRSLKTGTYP